MKAPKKESIIYVIMREFVEGHIHPIVAVADLKSAEKFTKKANKKDGVKSWFECISLEEWK